MTSTTPRRSAPSTPIHTTRSAERLALEDAINLGTTGLDWLDALLHAIEMLHERGEISPHIKHLAEMGRYMAEDFGSLLNSEREKLTACAKAGEVLQ